MLLEQWKTIGGKITKSYKSQLCDESNTKNSNDKSQIQLHIHQLEAVQQQRGCQSCGYYCLYYVSMISQIFEAITNNSDNVEFIRKLVNDLNSR